MYEITAIFNVNIFARLPAFWTTVISSPKQLHQIICRKASTTGRSRNAGGSSTLWRRTSSIAASRSSEISLPLPLMQRSAGNSPRLYHWCYPGWGAGCPQANPPELLVQVKGTEHYAQVAGEAQERLSGQCRWTQQIKAHLWWKRGPESSQYSVGQGSRWYGQGNDQLR